jgi:uncharacterized protein YaiI (UPF0178 family)
MQVWVDADACPARIRELLCRAADRRAVTTTFVANRPVRLPRSPNVRSRQVAAGFDEADRSIAAAVEPGDLVITADIPLAAQIVERGATALDPRGTLYTADSIPSHLARRNLMDELRSAGMINGGPPAFGDGDVQAFANALDRWLAANS